MAETSDDLLCHPWDSMAVRWCLLGAFRAVTRRVGVDQAATVLARELSWEYIRHEETSLPGNVCSEEGVLITGYGHGSPFDPVRERALEAYYEGVGPHPDGEDRPGRIK